MEQKEAQIQDLFEEGQRTQNDYASTSNQLQVALEGIAEQDSAIVSLRSENQNLRDRNADIEQEHAAALEVQQEMQSTIEGLKNQVEVLEARCAQAEKDGKPDADMEDANDDGQKEEDSTVDDSGFVDMDPDDNENAPELSLPQHDPASQGKRITEKPMRPAVPLSLNTVRNKQISKKGAEKSKANHARSLKRFVAASEKPNGEQTSKNIKSAEALQQVVQDEEEAEKARKAENMKRIMDNSVQFFEEGEYRFILYNKMMYNPEKTEFVLFIKREAGRQPVRAVVAEQNLHRDMQSQLLLPWPEPLLWVETLDVELTRMKFAVACLYAQIPDVQAEAARAFLTEEEYTAFCGRCFGKGMLRAPLSCKQDLSWPTKWDEAVNTLSTYKRFQTAARLWASGEKASDELRCWPPTFLNVKKQQSCTVHQDQDEQEAAEEYTTGANAKAVNDLTDQAAANLLLNF
ncbi:hypothetical protein HII31_05984 [Pseudocercospora fuligena]|uniref:Uncharacterized protein n=1 Tax=Pseudocercospora fuligena TaxID=685502 RepID=A0A8H6RL86_9PEZI|nr:hypothetical protein HII31_05984 [Pseudocercospora fuligena]